MMSDFSGEVAACWQSHIFIHHQKRGDQINIKGRKEREEKGNIRYNL